MAETTIQWWQFWTDPGIKPVIEQIVEDFEQQNPGVKVQLTDLTWANGHEKIVLAFASGSGPDVVELGSDWIAQFAESGHLEDISALIGNDSSAYQGWSMATYRDAVYARPWILGTRVLFFNKGLLARTVLKEDFVPVNWAEFMNAAQAVHALGKDIYGWGSNSPEKHRLYKKFLPFFWSEGARFFSESNKFCVVSSTHALSALKFYKALHDSCGYVARQREIEDAFLDGKIGYILSGDWLLKRIERENRTIDLGSTIFPGPSLPGRSFLGGEFLAVNAASQHKKIANKFVAFVTNSMNQLLFCKANRTATPSSVEAQFDEFFTSTPHFDTFIRQIRSANHPPVDPDWVFIETEIEDVVEKVIFGDALPASSLREIQLRITEYRRQ